MTTEVTQIRIGEFNAGIIGLKSVMEEMGAGFAHRSDDEIMDFMLERLGKANYIPSAARDKYGAAFLREYRRFMGQPSPAEDEAPSGPEIKVLGPGCFQCDSLEKTIMEILSEMQQPASVEHVTEMKDIARYGVMGLPALIVNGKVVLKGSVPPKPKLKQLVAEALASGK